MLDIKWSKFTAFKGFFFFLILNRDKSSESESEATAAKHSKSSRATKKRKSDGTSEESPESNKSKENSSYDADEDTDYESLDKSKESCLNDSLESAKKHFKLLSWNIDGIDSQSLATRTLGIVATILKWFKKTNILYFNSYIQRKHPDWSNDVIWCLIFFFHLVFY